jgi:hypothetical protein
MMFIGGICVSQEQAVHALDVLRESPGMMVRQPLQRAGNPLAACDYHAAAAPYRSRPQDVPAAGRGAAGRHLTKPAFVLAVETALALDRQADERKAELERAVAALQPPVSREDVDAAMAAFAVDCSYVTSMANNAVAVLRKRYAAGRRVALRAASQAAVALCSSRPGAFRCAAVAPCGTGDCRLARGVLAGLDVPAAREARGPALARPGNHVAAGDRFAPDVMLDSLLERQPWSAGGGLAIAV